MLKGFTLIEILIVISIIAILAAVTLPLYSYFLIFSVLDSAKQEVLQNIRLAQIKAQTGKNSSAFGVYFEISQYTLYQGDSHIDRDLSQDLLYSLPNKIEASNLTEINFAQKTGLPTPLTSTLILTNTANNAIETININQVGLIY